MSTTVAEPPTASATGYGSRRPLHGGHCTAGIARRSLCWEVRYAPGAFGYEDSSASEEYVPVGMPPLDWGMPPEDPGIPPPPVTVVGTGVEGCSGVSPAAVGVGTNEPSGAAGATNVAEVTETGPCSDSCWRICPISSATFASA